MHYLLKFINRLTGKKAASSRADLRFMAYRLVAQDRAARREGGAA